MAINIRNLITQANVLAQLVAQDFDDELDGVRAEASVQKLNNIIAQLNSSALFPFTRTSISYTILASQNSYTIGIDNENAIPIIADAIASRPEFIEKMYYKSSQGSAPYEVRQIDFKDMGMYVFSPNCIGLPTVFCIDNAYPLTNISFDMKPQSGAILQIVYTASITEVTINSEMAIPSKYASVLIPALARHLAVNQPSELLANIDAIYKENLRQLKGANMRSRIPGESMRPDTSRSKLASALSGYN